MPDSRIFRTWKSALKINSRFMWLSIRFELFQVCNIIGDWLECLEDSREPVDDCLESTLSSLVIKHFHPEHADRIFETQMGGITWLPELISHKYANAFCLWSCSYLGCKSWYSGYRIKMLICNSSTANNKWFQCLVSRCSAWLQGASDLLFAESPL